MSLTRALSLIGLVLTLVSGSVTMASARHQARAVDEVIICTGYGIATVSVDAEGNPTGPLILCPDCMPALAALTDTATPRLAAPTALTPVRFSQRITPTATPAALPAHQPRAPPSLA